jgi:predicted dehydrogenase
MCRWGVGDLVTRVGMIGLSEGNGHPFSFSSIINGYSDEGLAASGWQVIYDYVRRRDRSEFGIEGLQVTHAWTQDRAQTEKLCRACLIQNTVDKYEDMLGHVDAVVIARDDFENHFKMAMPFLEAGLYVFVDKPLSLDIEELRKLRLYLESGQLMSCSGLYYAKELDEVRAGLQNYGRLKLIRGAVVSVWEKYGVHMLYAIFSFVKATPVWVLAMEAPHFSVAVGLDDGCLLQVDALGECPKTFSIDIWGDKSRSSHEIVDNFSMFRRMLWHFAQSIKTKKPAMNPGTTMNVMRILIAGRTSQKEKRKVFLNEIEL